MQKTIKLSLLSAALMSQLNAQNISLAPIEVTSSQGTSLNKKDVTDNVTVITKEEIQQARVTTLNKALQKLANISMTQNGGPGTSASFHLRGMSRGVLVLVDGVRFNNPTLPSATAEFSQIMLNNVEQIEIIKGSQSGVWGSDASGGVINIITSKAQKGLHATTGIEYGAYDTLQTALGVSYATNKYDLLASGNYVDTDGFSASAPKKSEADYGKRSDDLGLEKDGYKNKTLKTKFGYQLTDNDRIEANIQAINSFINFDSWAGSSGDSSIPNTYLQNRFYMLAYKHQDSLNDFKVQYNLSTFNRKNTYSSSNSINKGSVNEIKADDKINYMESSFIRFGASYQNYKQTDVSPNTDKSYNALAAFVTNYNKVNLFSDLNTIVTESVRYDKYNTFDNSVTGKVGIKQFILNDLYISTNIGTGYNTPTLAELYGQWGANPDLTPEKSLTSDITLGNDTLWITGFYNKVTDLIEYDMTTYAYVQTSGTSRFRGFELGYEDYYFDSVQLQASYRYVETKNANGKALARRPKSQLDTTVTYYATENLDFGINAQYVGTRYDSDSNNATQTGKYTVANFVTNIQANKFVTFYAKINNITDKYYQTVDGYATAGRSLYVGFNAKY